MRRLKKDKVSAIIESYLGDLNESPVGKELESLDPRFRPIETPYPTATELLKLGIPRHARQEVPVSVPNLVEIGSKPKSQ